MNLLISKRRHICFAVCFLLGFAMILYKCQFGFANLDESFYLTVPYRLTMGDSLFQEEWHVSQMAGFLIYPILTLYRLFVPDTQGLFLNFRYIFTVLHALVALLIYIRLRRHGVAAIAASVIYLLFAPFGIMALSYNSLGVGLTVISGVLLATSSGRWYDPFLSGLAFAGAVLCSPYLVLVYVLYAAACLVCAALARAGCISDKVQPKPILRTLLFFTLGCVLLAGIFVIFLLSRASLSDMLRALPQILSDPEHPISGFGTTVVGYFGSILKSNRAARYIFPLCALLAVVILADRKPGKRRYGYFFFACLLSAIYFFCFFPENLSLNFYLFPPAVLGIFSFLLCPEQNWRLFLFAWLPGILYGFCLRWTSNQGFYVISMAAAVSTAASCAMVGTLISRWRAEPDCPQVMRTLLRAVPCVLLVIFVLLEGTTRYQFMFWADGTMEEMTQEITQGAEAGLYTTPQKAQDYALLYEDTQSVRQEDQGPVLYFALDTYLYLCDTKEFGCYSAWLSGIGDNSFQKLLTYYQLNPDKVPNIVYTLNRYAWVEEHVYDIAQQYGYAVEETDMGYILRRLSN